MRLDEDPHPDYFASHTSRTGEAPGPVATGDDGTGTDPEAGATGEPPGTGDAGAEARADEETDTAAGEARTGEETGTDAGEARVDEERPSTNDGGGEAGDRGVTEQAATEMVESVDHGDFPGDGTGPDTPADSPAGAPESGAAPATEVQPAGFTSGSGVPPMEPAVGVAPVPGIGALGGPDNGHRSATGTEASDTEASDTEAGNAEAGNADDRGAEDRGAVAAEEAADEDDRARDDVTVPEAAADRAAAEERSAEDVRAGDEAESAPAFEGAPAFESAPAFATAPTGETAQEGVTEPADRTELSPGEAATPTAIVFWETTVVDGFRDRWQQIQLRFIDDPRRAAEQAQSLAGDVCQQLTDTVARHRDELDRWRDSQASDTEELRVALRRYRDLLDRLLGL